MTCIRCKHSEAKRFGFYGPHKIQRYRCPACKNTFSEPRQRPLGRHYILTEKAVQIISLLTEGMSIRAVSRITGVHKTTILSLLITVGDKCSRVFDARISNVKTRFVQADELWSFVHTKERHLASDDPQEWGDAYTWIALDSESKMVLSYHVGKRDAVSAFILARDLSDRVTGRFQITTDGFKPYISAIEDCFGSEVDYAQLIKIYGRAKTEGPDWYAPTKVLDAIPVRSAAARRLSASLPAMLNEPTSACECTFAVLRG